MSVPIVTAESVAAAVAELRAKNQEVTYRAIEAIIGGSHRDIGRYLRAHWEQEVAQVGNTVATNNTPSDIDKCLRDTASKIEGIVARRAATELRGFRAELEAKITLLASQRDSAMKDFSDLEDDLDRAKESNAAMQIALEEQKQQVQSLQREVADARTERAAATAAQAATQARITDFKEVQDGLLRDLDAEKVVIGQLLERERESVSELKAARAQAAQVEVNAARELAQAEATNKQLQRQVEKQDLEYVAARQELYESHMALLEMTERAAKAEGELEAARQQREEAPLASDRKPTSAGRNKPTVADIKTGGAS